MAALPVNLSRTELVELTGYKRPCDQLRWIRDKLKIEPPLRRDGLPVLFRTQLEAVTGQQKAAALTPGS
jgi:hypothetical protein